mgnify:CR=1 FL=1
MIYQRFGSPLKIVAYCGKHVRKGFLAPMILVRVDYLDRAEISYQFAHTLKADGGINEIDAAIDAVPEVKLAAFALKDALKKAE